MLQTSLRDYRGYSGRIHPIAASLSAGERYGRYSFCGRYCGKIGVERAIQSAKEADLILYVVDASVPLDENDFHILSFIQEKPCVVLLNKTDLPSVVTESVLKDKLRDHRLCLVIKVSLKEKKEWKIWRKAIQKLFFSREISFENEVYITNIRQKEALQEAYDSVHMVKRKCKRLAMPEDFYTIDLMNAYACLGKIIGEEVGDDLVNEIFSRFCMGK